MNYLFGYGSIINPSSRTKTGRTGHSFPVTISGFQRAWNLPVPNHPVTALGATKKTNSKCNGVLVEILKNELKKFDDREKGYQRMLVDSNNINNTKPNDSTWIYINQKTSRPTKKKPIIQSYLDVVLNGCLKINQTFTINFIKTTLYWDSYWINDREKPIYPRSMKHNLRTFNKIDNLLEQTIPMQFAKRKVI